MGKSTAAAIFRRAAIPVFDADAAVHDLQGRGGGGVRSIGAAFPGSVRNDEIDRDLLRGVVLERRDGLAQLERILHPLVRQKEQAFLRRMRRAGKSIAVLDIPLLLETGGERRTDLVVVVSAPPAVQEQRVRRRRRMTAAEASAMIARQMPDREKIRRADIVVRTGLSRHHTYRVISRLIRILRNDPLRAFRYRDHRTRAPSWASHH